MKLRMLLGYAAPYRASLAFAGIMMLLEIVAVLTVPWLGGQFAGGLLSHGQTDLNIVLVALLALFALQALIKFANGYVLSRTGQQILADLRIRVYDHLQALPLSFYHQRRQGDILALITYEVDHLAGFISNTMLSIVPLLFTMVGAVVLMFRIDALLAGIVAVLVPFFYLLLKLVGRRLRPLALQMQQVHADAVAIAEENLGMLPAIKTFTREVKESRRYSQKIRHLMNLGITQDRIFSALEPTVQFIAAAAVVLLLWVAAGQVGGGAMTPAELISFLLYAALLTRPASALSQVYGATQLSRGVLRRLQSVLTERPEPIFAAGRILARAQGNIEFRNVYFAYAGRPVTLLDVNLHIRAGETVAITGRNGAGKSTLAHLLMRLHEPDAGRIFVNGVDIASVSLHSLRSHIGIVPQHVLLFNGSVRDNIAYGKVDATFATIERAAKAAQAHDFMTALPQGFDTFIGDNGIRLSGGQRQRIALARALLKDPPILILDEATAMFDPECERSFIEESHSSLAERTVILITHRPASLALADRVVELQEGKIVSIEPTFGRSSAIHGSISAT